MLTIQTRTLIVLGYSTVYIRNHPGTFPVNTTIDELTYIESLVTQIESLDTELLANTKDSMAVKVQDLGLDYNRYIMQTLSLQDSLKQRLSMVTDIPLYDSGGSATMAYPNYY